MLLFHSQVSAFPVNMHHEESLYGSATLPFVDCCCLFLDGGQCDGGVLEFPVLLVMPQSYVALVSCVSGLGFSQKSSRFLWQSNSTSYLQ